MQLTLLKDGKRSSCPTSEQQSPVHASARQTVVLPWQESDFVPSKVSETPKQLDQQPDWALKYSLQDLLCQKVPIEFFQQAKLTDRQWAWLWKHTDLCFMSHEFYKRQVAKPKFLADMVSHI